MTYRIKQIEVFIEESEAYNESLQLDEWLTVEQMPEK